MATTVEITGNNLRTQLPKAKDVTKDIQFPDSSDHDPLRGVNEPSGAWQDMNETWRMTRALIGGTKAMRKADTEFLPREQAETQPAYERRIARSVLFNAYRETIKTSTGRPLSKPIVFEKFGGRLEELNEDIDLRGNDIDTFCRNVFFNALAHGHNFIFIDHPKRPDDADTLEADREMRLRPYWNMVRAVNVIGWRSEFRGGAEMPTQIRIRETGSVPRGLFGMTTTKRVRVLIPGAWTLYEQDAESNQWRQIDAGQFVRANGEPLNYIPIVPFFTDEPEDFFVSRPKLLDLAYMNVNHWQSYSDQQNILHVARVPVLFGAGFHTDEDFEIGSGSWIKGPEGSSLQYVEHSGAAIGAGRDDLEAMENRMRIMGAEILVRDPARVTATQKIIDTDEATSDLQATVGRFEDALSQAYAITADWLNERADAVGKINIFKDFGISADAFQEAQNLLQMRIAKQITQETFLMEMKRRGLLGDDVDIAVEVAQTTAEADMSFADEGDADDANFNNADNARN